MCHDGVVAGDGSGKGRGWKSGCHFGGGVMKGGDRIATGMKRSEGRGCCVCCERKGGEKGGQGTEGDGGIFIEHGGASGEGGLDTDATHVEIQTHAPQSCCVRRGRGIRQDKKMPMGREIAIITQSNGNLATLATGDTLPTACKWLQCMQCM